MVNDEHRIEALESRVDKIEDTTRVDIIALHTKIDNLTTLINGVLVATAKSSCPAPGTCVTLGVTVQELIKAHNATMLRVERLELKIMDIDRDFTKWKWQFLGGLSTIIFLLTMFGPSLRKLFKLE